MLPKKLTHYLGALACANLIMVATGAAPLLGQDVQNAFNLEGFYENVVHYKLKNGMHVVLKPDPTSKVTSLHLRVNTGSIHEEGFFGSGLSHFFEHSLFLGSKKHPAKNSLSSKVESLGGDEFNAYTTYNHTAYYFTILAENTKEGLEVMEDLVFHPLFRAEDVRDEKGSILAEMAMRSDQPNTQYYRLINQFVFKNLPYKYPVIGYKKSFDALATDDLLNYYYTRYKPNNMILSMVGNFKLSEVIPVIEKFYGQHKAGDIKPLKFEADEPWNFERMEITHPKATHIRVSWLWKTVSYYDDEMYPLDLLASLVGGGETSLLYKRLKEELELVRDIDAYSWTPREDGVFSIGCSIDPIKDRKALLERIEAIESEIKKTIKHMAKGKIEDRQVEIAHRSLVGSLVARKEKSINVARGLAGSVMSTGGINYDAVYMSNFMKVKPKDVAKVAKKFLQGTEMKMALMLPKGLYKDKLYKDSVVGDENTGNTPINVSHDMDDRRVAGINATLLSDEELASLEKQTVHVTGFPSFRTTKSVLKNGLTMLHYEDRNLPRLVVVLAGPGGLTYEGDEDINGGFAMWSKMFMTSNQQYSREEMTEFMELHGIDVSAFAGRNSFGLEMSFLKDKQQQASDLLKAIVNQKTYSSKDFEKEKSDYLFGLKSRQESGWYVSGTQFNELFFKGTPYSRPAAGSEASIGQLTVDHMNDLRAQFINPKEMVFSVYGDLGDSDAKTLFGWLEDVSSDDSFPEREPAQFEPLRYDPKQGPKKSYGGFRQTFLRMAYRAPKQGDEDAVAFKVLMGYFSGMGGPLFELRSVPSKKGGGRAYSLGAFYDQNLHYGTAVFYAALRHKDDAEEVMDDFQKEIDQVKAVPLSEDALMRAKLNVIGGALTDIQDLGNRALQESLNELYGHGYDADDKELEAAKKISAEDLHRVAKKYFVENGFLVHLLLPKASDKASE